MSCHERGKRWPGKGNGKFPRRMVLLSRRVVQFGDCNAGRKKDSASLGGTKPTQSRLPQKCITRRSRNQTVQPRQLAAKKHKILPRGPGCAWRYSAAVDRRPAPGFLGLVAAIWIETTLGRPKVPPSSFQPAESSRKCATRRYSSARGAKIVLKVFAPFALFFGPCLGR